jgi:hypothetical protein
MGHETDRLRNRAALGALLAALSLLLFVSTAQAAPKHPREEALDIPNLNHACGVAVDTKGDFYASSAGESKVKVFNPAHVLLTEIEDTHEPCGLAVTTTGNLYVSEKATGEVVRFKPGAYPFVGTPTYGSREVIDASTNAKGIAVDRFDNRLYVAEGTKVAIYKADGSFEANVGEGTLTEATGVAAFTYPYSVNNEGNPEKANHYLWVADAKGLEADSLYLFGGEAANALTLDRKLDGSNTPDGSFGFGAAGAYLAADPGNRNAEGKCLLAEGELERKQACTAGHLFLYDETHKALDEFDVTGEYLDQIKNPAFADAEPTAIAIARSGASGDGTIYVTAGSGAGAKALAFGPLLPPSRKALAEPLSHTTNLKNIVAVATDSYGDVYAASDASIHVYQPNGTELKTASKPLIEDGHTPVDLAVDSACNVYVLDENDGVIEDAEVTYYEPSQCPPKAGTTYKRHEELVATPKDDQDWFKGIAVNPGPGSGKDHLFVTAIFRTREYDSAANNSALLNGEFAKCVQKVRQSIAVYGANGNVYIGIQGKFIHEVDKTGKCLSQFEATGASNGKIGANPYVAVDQSNGHVVEYDQTHTAREYDSAGSFIAEFGNFTEGLGNLTFRVAVDSSCAVHEPPLSGKACEEFDSANGNAYVAFADTKSTEHPPFKGVNAFGVLDYPQKGEAPTVVSGIADEFGPGAATLHGTVNPHEAGLEECEFEYLTDAKYQENVKKHPGDAEAAFEGAKSKACAESFAEIGEGTDPVAAHAEVTNLDPEAPYRFRLVAKNSGGEKAGEAVLFGPPVITAKSALPILYHEVTLRADIGSSALETEYRFEYLDRQSFEEQGGFEGPATHHTELGELAAGEAAVPVSASLFGLTEGTEYLFRAVAKNVATRIVGETRSFVTQARRGFEECPNAIYRFGLSSNLPDCRAYELTTPAQTDGLIPGAENGGGTASGSFSNWLTAQRGAGAGERLSYFTNGTLPGFEGNGLLDGYRAERGVGDHPVDGWQSALFSPGYLESAPGIHKFALQHGIAPDQLYSIWEINSEPETFPETLPHGVYLQTPAGLEVLGKGSLGTDLGALSRYVSAGGAHAIFASKEHLEEKAAPSGTEAIYDRGAGSSSAEVVSVKPDGSAFGGGQGASYAGASEDGAAVAFSVGGTLYLHRAGATSEIATAPNTFAGISEDGAKVFYAATADGASAAALYVCDVESGPCAGEGAHLPTKIATSGIFVLVSPEGSHAFFSSTEALSGAEENENGEEAEAGKRNLYAWDGAKPNFVGQLAASDFSGFAGSGEMNLAAWTRALGLSPLSGRAYVPTRSSADGGAFAFQSHARLTAYDNKGKGEIYRYEPAAEGGEQLLCVSCDPSGTAPSADALLEDLGAASPLKPKSMVANLTEDGQEVFFQSPDRLLPEDANEVEDVYEWKAKGAGTPECTRPGGCLALISSGQGEVPSFLYAMSGDGHDVFFQTKEQLVGSDVPGSPSIYDAREFGGIPEPSPPAPCQGDACQGVGTLPSALPSPASTGGGEAGGEAPSPPVSSCAKGKHRVKGRCVASKHHKRHAKKHRRAGSNRGGTR